MVIGYRENMNDSIWLASDSNVIRQSELYKQGILLPDRTVPVGERSFAVRNDDYLVAGMAVMFFLLAVILYRSRNVFLYRLKNFFTSKRTYTDDDVEGNSDEAIHVFLLISKYARKKQSTDGICRNIVLSGSMKLWLISGEKIISNIQIA